jgi:hypothetical protein
MDNPAMQQFLEQNVSEYNSKNYGVYFTGHSAGADQASVASSQFKQPAIVFDNPGLKKSDQFDSSGVTSFQSGANLVNSFAGMTGRSFDYGTEVQLPGTLGDQATNAALNLAGKKVPIFNTLNMPVKTLFSHPLVAIEERLENVMRPSQ